MVSAISSPRRTIESHISNSAQSHPYSAPRPLFPLFAKSAPVHTPVRSLLDTRTALAQSPRKTYRLDDPDDMLCPTWEVPPDPRHPHAAALRRGINRTAMRPLLRLGLHIMGGLLESSGFRRATVATRMGKLNYFDSRGTGTLPPLFLVLGIGGTTTDYLAMLRRLRPHFQRVLALDLPGHGYSGPALGAVNDETVVGSVQDALDQLLPADGSAILLGHSLGGYLAARYASARPERISGVVLCEPLGAPFDAKQREGFVRLYRLETRRKIRVVIHNAFYNDRKDNHIVASAAWARLTQPIARTMINSDLFTNALKPELLQNLKTPVMLVWGQDDHLLPDSHLTYFTTNLPAATRIAMPAGVNHNNTAVGPPQVIAPVVEWSGLLAAGVYAAPAAEPAESKQQLRPAPAEPTPIAHAAATHVPGPSVQTRSASMPPIEPVQVTTIPRAPWSFPVLTPKRALSTQ